METLKRIGNPFSQVPQKNKSLRTRYQALGQHEDQPVCEHGPYYRLLMSSIAMNVAAVVIMIGFYFKLYGAVVEQCEVHELESDRLFGHIPWKLQLIDNNQRFIDAKPPPYMVGDIGINKTDSVNPWDDIFPSTWVALSKPSLGKVDGWGMKMKQVAADPDEWEEDSEGYGVAVMHQVHCVAVVKYALLTYEETGKSDADQVHLHHCVETLRQPCLSPEDHLLSWVSGPCGKFTAERDVAQAIMCHADMTLEHPGMDNPYEVVLTGWGNTHLCRDWDSVVAAISKHAIKHKPNGWAKFDEGELKVRVGL